MPVERSRVRRKLATVLVAFPLVLLLAATSASATPSKPYATGISPDAVLAGTCATYTVYLENQTRTQQLGSANYTLDSDFVVGSASCPVSVTTDRGNATPVGHVIQLRDLALPPGERVAFSFAAATTCPPAATPYVNDVIAKQANNYSGDPGNDLTKDGTPFDLTVDVAGTCSDDPTTPLPLGGTSGSSYSLVSNGTGSGRLVLAVNFDSVDCADYTEHTDTVTVDLLFNTSDTKTLTLTFNNVNNEPKSSFRFCLDPADGEAYLIPGCAKTVPSPPCLLSVDQTKKIITMKVLLPSGDPPGRG